VLKEDNVSKLSALFEKYLENGTEETRYEASNYGQELLRQNVDPDEIVGIFVDMIEGFRGEDQKMVNMMGQADLLLEVMVHYGVVFKEAIEHREKLLEYERRERELVLEMLEVERVKVRQEQKLRQMKTRFMSTATHELRTPLTSIQGYTDLIQMDAGNLSESQRQYFSVILRNVQRLTKLTDDLLEQQRLEEGRIRVTFEQVNVLELVEMVRSEFMPIIGAKRQTCEVSCVDVVVGMDRLRLMQVLVNLLSNANKFSPEGSAIVVDVVETGDGVQFSVSDSGVGIRKEDLGKLFSPFPGILVEGNVGGTGLGLSISKGIVELHGGEIWAESEGKGKGSKFTFTIPNKK